MRRSLRSLWQRRCEDVRTTRLGVNGRRLTDGERKRFQKAHRTSKRNVDYERNPIEAAMSRADEIYDEQGR